MINFSDLSGIKSVLTLTELKDINAAPFHETPISKPIVYIEGHTLSGDGGAGFFCYKPGEQRDDYDSKAK